MTQLRLRAYTPNGASLGLLPTPVSCAASYPFNDLGALTLEYSPQAPQASLLGKPLEVAVEVSNNDGATWTEPQDSRFLYLRDGRDPVVDDNLTAECPGYVNRLRKAIIPNTGLNEEGRREFATTSLGTILRTLIVEAQARGALTGLAFDFGTSSDSNGNAWAGAAAAQSIAYDVGKDLLSVLTEWVALGWVDFHMAGRTLRLFNAEAGGVDRTLTGTPPILRKGRDLTDAPMRRTWENLADTALVVGDAGTSVTRTNGAAVTPWGRQETFVSASGVEDAGTLQVIGDGALAQTANVREEHTYGLAFYAPTSDVAPTENPNRPFRNFMPGDWIYVEDANAGAQPVRMRVRQITLSLESNGTVSGNAVLNDRFQESDVLQQRRLDALLQGATTATGGTPAGVGPDILAPGKVLGMTAQSVNYLDAQGFPQAQVSLDWADVLVNADGTPITDLAGYDVQRRKAGASSSQGGTFATFAGAVAASAYTSSPYEPGRTWEFRARAIDTAGNEGAWSDVVAITVANDTTGPIAPKTPTAAQRLGGSVFGWDGTNGVNGGAMDADLLNVQLHVSTSSSFTPVKDAAATLRAIIGRGGGEGYVGGLTYGTTYYARLLPIDTSGNAGTPSAVRSVTIAPLVDVSNFPDSAVESLTARVGEFLVVTSDMFVGNTFQGVTFTGATFQTDVAGDRVVIRPDGSSGVVEFWSSISGSSPGTIDAVSDLGGSGERFQRVDITSGKGDPNAVVAAIRIRSGNAGVGGTFPSRITLETDSTVVAGELRTQGAVLADQAIQLSPAGGGAWAAASTASGYTSVTGFPVEYCLDAAGTVHIRGRINRTTAISGATLFTLPAGFRPSAEIRAIIDAEPVTAFGTRVVVQTDGQVRPYYKQGTPTLYYTDLLFTTR